MRLRLLCPDCLANNRIAILVADIRLEMYICPVCTYELSHEELYRRTKAA